ncbi:hypothetical protein AAV94_06930 [Lampropedia cohaerens]|uniref:Uncharacterized protein n=1 Tax=Lampropedia cohaerens TaxID=1610491 RepID=A0A0U1Q0C1_9BURK|nr:Fur family transcriptional regulator [Lampropedia cohaerens]KKW68181.1 hypothetical protein AAV94_06930 [Lampropedia cohaerens]
MLTDITTDNVTLLRGVGLKATVPRLRVLEVLQSKSCGIDVHQIYLELLESDRGANLSTVYAVLKQLTACGLVDVHWSANRKALYVLRSTGNHAAIATCVSCGQSMELPGDELEEYVRMLVARQGGQFRAFSVDVQVVCAACLQHAGALGKSA